MFFFSAQQQEHVVWYGMSTEKKHGKNDGSNPAPHLLQISLGDGAVLLDRDLRIQGSFSADLSGGIVVEPPHLKT